MEILFNIALPSTGTYNYYYLDNISIKANLSAAYDSTVIPGTTEMTDLMGYTPTYAYTLSWDQAIQANGRIYL
jgi:hypothetical protein